ncbi:sphingomyelin synthase-related protein 1 [Bemisia tabaci]|uniref:sphingomyelin synthase-related protein 1 n=1 Tax=Bemisia tabaci TaxID=7038 RepID=UPI003B27E1FC
MAVGSKTTMSEAAPSSNVNVIYWSVKHVKQWLHEKGYDERLRSTFEKNRIDGKALLLLNDSDLRSPLLNITALGDMKRLNLDIRQLKADNRQSIQELGFDPTSLLHLSPCSPYGKGLSSSNPLLHKNNGRVQICEEYYDSYNELGYTDPDVCYTHSTPSSEDGLATKLRPEVSKTLIAMAYVFVVTWITAFVMVIVHDRVPDMKRYPPLPDIFLDNVPYIPWAFHMCEWTGTLLLLIWICVLVFHKHRFILLRRFFALSGTVFLLRCITMLITSLSVPGTHLECNPRTYAYDENENIFMDIMRKVKQAYIIWRGAGMSIQGVRTCGDYMFSGHTVALTMLNFFITEYTPRDIYILHTFTWMLNMFGIFFILSGHEHYSIDVFIAFYITSRLFLYYHTLANNQALMQRDSNRTRIWFPLFSYFESSVDGMVPNEYESTSCIIKNLFNFILSFFLQIALFCKSRIRYSTHILDCNIFVDNSNSRYINKKAKVKNKLH